MLRALALLPHEALNSLRQQALTGKDQSASIIAPGRRWRQAAPLPKLVSTQAANGGGEGQPLAA